MKSLLVGLLPTAVFSMGIGFALGVLVNAGPTPESLCRNRGGAFIAGYDDVGKLVGVVCNDATAWKPDGSEWKE